MLWKPKNKNKNSCSRCGGRGGSDFPSWMRHNVNGMPGACFRCKGSGIDPVERKQEMCSSMKYSGTSNVIRDYPKLKVSYGKAEGSARLSGFAKIERHSFWKDSGDAVNVSIAADTFIEGKVEVSVPGGKIAGIGLRRDVKVNGKTIGQAKTVRILTREARSEFEKKHHHRWPIVYNGTDMYIFSEKDEINPQQKLPL